MKDINDLNSTTDHLIGVQLRRATSGAGRIYMLAIDSTIEDDPEVFLLTRADLNRLRDLCTDALLERGEFAR